MEKETRPGRYGGKLNTGGSPPGAGRPRKMLGDVTAALNAEGYVPVTKSDVETVYKTLLHLDEERLKGIVGKKSLPMLLRIVAKAMLDRKGFEVIEKMAQRAFGGPGQDINIKGDISATVLGAFVPESITVTILKAAVGGANDDGATT